MAATNFVEAARAAQAHLNSPVPNNREALREYYTKTNMHKLALELFAGNAIQSVRNTDLYKALRARMELIYLELTGQQLPP